MEGIEVRKKLRDAHVNLAQLANGMGISPQSLNTRLRAKTFKRPYLVEITQVLGKDIFGLQEKEQPTQPIIDLAINSGTTEVIDGLPGNIVEYVSIPSFAGCIGIVYHVKNGHSKYSSGDTLFVKRASLNTNIEFGKTYLIVTDTDRYLKTVYKSQQGKDFVALSSDSNSPDTDFDIKIKNITHIYKIVELLRRVQI